MNQAKIGKFLAELWAVSFLWDSLFDLHHKDQAGRGYAPYGGRTEHSYFYGHRVRICNSIALLFLVVYMLFKDTTLYVQNEVVSIIIDVALGVSLGMLLTGFVFSGRYGIKIRAFKQRIFKRQ